jgi:crotonobetainyl-CoA:carnitine CoA-transferase CaiB-like acyl-CoA transferase
MSADPLIDQVRQAVFGAVDPEGPAEITVTGTPGHLPSRLPAEDAAVATVAAALLASAALARQRGRPVERVTLDRGHVSGAVRSERYFVREGQPPAMTFAPLSRFWPTSDGWVRTHANYPWHRAALGTALGVRADHQALAEAIADLRAVDVEERVVAAGGVAAAVRTASAWQAHPQGLAVAGEPLVDKRAVGGAPPRHRPGSDLPAAGVRVLDLTRVIAGPVCTRFLGALGADVLRVDPPERPDMRPGMVSDTLLGKRSALLDLASEDGLAAVHDLLGQADVVMCGYRPTSLDRFGLGFEALAERHPGIVAVYVAAWGHSGPWAARRGFDSLVQAATGIALIEAGDAPTPGALPCQLLDHGTGYLAAAAVLDGLRSQADLGGTEARYVSLARTARWLMAAPPPTAHPEAKDDVDPSWVVPLDSANGPVTAVAPPGQLDDEPLRWPFLLTGYGNDRPTWPNA